MVVQCTCKRIRASKVIEPISYPPDSEHREASAKANHRPHPTRQPFKLQIHSTCDPMTASWQSGSRGDGWYCDDDTKDAVDDYGIDGSGFDDCSGLDPDLCNTGKAYFHDDYGWVCQNEDNCFIKRYLSIYFIASYLILFSICLSLYRISSDLILSLHCTAP